MSLLRFFMSVFLIFLALSFGVLPVDRISCYYARGQDPGAAETVESCDMPGKQTTHLPLLELILTPNDESVSFMCSSKQDAKLTPEATKVYSDSACHDTTELSRVFAGSVLDESVVQKKKKFTLKIPKETRKISTVLFYKCTFTGVNVGTPQRERQDAEELPAAPATECKVKITVDPLEPTNPETEPNTEQQAGVVQCASEDGTKQATVSAESPLSFKCGAGMSLHPTNLTDVFDDQDGKCAAEVALQTLVDATLTKAETDPPQNDQQLYQLAVTTAPSGDTALCYKCVTPSASSKAGEDLEEGSSVKQCLLKISVKGNASSASARWGAAEGGTALLAAAQMLLGLLYV
ncbi:SRS domain-containing protein [Neospora caninum Liverpool]|uniref:SRS domain-containing protein n=1 Tax=Neospora caninum (strain Liverpool) TaxID=572307 RepID=F0VL93_NEOCL|nr:SRS domain-containing protein [Neospora caninum Liverpool]CBZ54845.1 SRS domain-containing protein [Neospora caninum Liverpool]CEL69564.1 TPA: SRS domain-containing protein [Neospora caninum Liverpool]|eukprot:XP_003884873.1 SRS domain-containing protein [Neospora caninum Liverpool]